MKDITLLNIDANWQILRNKKIILVSASLRRQQLLHNMGLNFEIRPLSPDIEIDKSYPSAIGGLTKEEIALYLCEMKANAFKSEIEAQTIIISADTIVCLENEIIGKPKNYEDAVNILKKLSGKMHEVITGVCIKSKDKTKKFYDVTNVWFKNLTNDEIEYYLKKYKPYDKAGAYGIQEWLGYIAIEKIEGSFYNVMGLPTHKLYEVLRMF